MVLNLVFMGVFFHYSIGAVLTLRNVGPAEHCSDFTLGKVCTYLIVISIYTILSFFQLSGKIEAKLSFLEEPRQRPAFNGNIQPLKAI